VKYDLSFFIDEYKLQFFEKQAPRKEKKTFVFTENQGSEQFRILNKKKLRDV
jgi:hypothetical protein